MQERLKSKTEGKARVLANEMKTSITDKVEGIEKLSEEDFNGLDHDRVCVSLYLKSLKMFTNAQDVATTTVVSQNFAAVAVLLLLSPTSWMKNPNCGIGYCQRLEDSV